MKNKALAIISMVFCLLQTQPASAALDHIALQGELVQVRGAQYPSNPADSNPGVLLGAAFSFNNVVEFKPNILLTQGGQYKGFLLDAGIKLTPSLFELDDYFFDVVCPYIGVGGSASYPFALGFYVKGGVHVAIAQFIVGAEIGYRNHKIESGVNIESPFLALRAGMFF